MQWSDSGPGRFGVDGFNHFPSTPNGTEICQEMDQLFAYLKSLLNDNMDKIEKGRWEVEDPLAQLSMEEIASAIFGLDVTMKNGKVVELVDAFVGPCPARGSWLRSTSADTRLPCETH